jgi:hypothetical protein
MKKALVGIAAAVAVLSASGARANLIPFGGSAAASFTDLGAEGFGDAHRLLTLQNSPTEAAQAAPDGLGGTTINPYNGQGGASQANAGVDKTNATHTASDLGWTLGSNVGIGFNPDQVNHTGITLTGLTLTIYNGTTAVDSFSLSPTFTPLVYSSTLLDLASGNANGIFLFVLDSTEQGTFNTDMAANGSSSYTFGVGASLTGSNDGPDTFLAVSVGAPGPIAGAGLPGVMAMLVGGLMWWRRKLTFSLMP